MLYNFFKPFIFDCIADSTFCNGFGAAEKIIFVYNSEGRQMIPGCPSHDIATDAKDVIGRYERNKKQFQDSLLVAWKNGEDVEFTETIDFRDFNLEPGVYQVRALYYQYDVSRYVSDQLVAIDERRYNAQIFKGCLWSNGVKLIVK